MPGSEPSKGGVDLGTVLRELGIGTVDVPTVQCGEGE